MNSARSRKPGAGQQVRPKTVPRRRKRMGWLARVVACCVLAVVVLVAWAMLARVLAPRENTSHSRFDALIVLGDPADADGNPTPAQLARVNEGVHEYERGAAPRMIFTGGAVRNQFVEAQVMARAAEAQGIPAGAIVEETQSRNTIENACDSLRIMRSRGWRSAEIVTSPAQAPRVAMIFSRLPLDWRIHAAPPVEPESSWLTTYAAAKEVAKTTRYLVWTRQMEPCEIQGLGTRD